MAANNVIINNNAYQQYYTNFQFCNDKERLASSPINYQSDDSSSLSYSDHSSLSRMEDSSPSTASITSAASCLPYLEVLEEPKDQIRFRYKSEKGFHGGLKPVIKLHNFDCSNNVWIKATLYTCGKCPMLHVYELGGKQCQNGASWQKLSKDFKAKFPSLSICMKKRDEIPGILTERIKQKYKDQRKRITAEDIAKEVDEIMISVNFNSGQLCFEAFHEKNEMNPVCEFPVFSKPIYNQKSTLAGELKITRLSMYSGKASGNEDMILLCEKVRKDDIEIIFYSQNENGNIDWEEKASFNPADVHHQVAIPLKTPRFIQNIEKEVFIRLQRKSDGKVGEPRTFFYKPCDDFEGNPFKRKRPNPSDDVPISLTDMQWDSNTSSYLDLINDKISDSFLEQFHINIDLPFDALEPIVPEGVPNLASLNLNEKKEAVKKRRDEDIRLPIQILKNGIINLLKEREYTTFMSFLPALLSMRDENGNSLLHLTVMEKSDNLPLLIKMVEVTPEGSINQTNKAKMTPLHIAVRNGLWKIVRILLMMGADPNIRDGSGNTCTHIAATYSLPWCLAEILAPLLGEKKRRHMPVINSLNYEGFAPLHLSVKNDSKICVKLLLQAKAEINISDGKCGKTPLHIAYEKHSDLVSLLQSHPGVNPNAEDFNGILPHSCISRGNKNSSHVSKPTECCIELSTESSNSKEDEYYIELKEEEGDMEEKGPNKEGEDIFCKTLNLNGLWKKFGLYIKEEKELNVIGVMDANPTETILNELKKQHGEKYSEKLKFILSDEELKEFAYLLKVRL